MKQLIVLLAFCLFIISCKRRGEPVPAICTKESITQGDNVTIRLTDTLALVNCSKRSTKQRWVMPDGGSSTNETAYFVPTSTGTFQVRLYVSNDDFVNEYEDVKNIIVTP